MGSNFQVKKLLKSNLEGENSIEATMETPRTGGQQANPMIDESKPKENKGRNKRKCKRSKITFAELLDKYQKKSEEKNAYRPNHAKKPRSPPRRKYEDWYWQSDNFNATYSYPYFGPPMPMPWMPPYAHIDTYSSWDRYDTRAHSPSYFRPSHQYYAAPRRSTFEQSHVKDRFNHKESVQSSRKKKEVVKQVYLVKRDGRKSATSDLISNEKEPINVLTLATKDNETKQPIIESRSAKSEEKKLRVHKAKKELPLVKTESQPRCLLSLSYWQKNKLQKLSAQELEERNMAWVPKGSAQNKNYVQASITRSAAKVKKEKSENYEGPSRRFQHLWSTHYPYSSTMPLTPMPWNSSSGTIGNPQWAYFNPWMQYNFLHHERVLPNHHMFD